MKHSLKEVNEKLANKLVSITFLFVILIAVVLLFRWKYLGWNNLFYAYLVICSGLLGLFVFRKKISAYVKLLSISALMLSSGFCAMIYLGLSGAYYMSIASIILVTFIAGSRTGTVYSILFAIVYLATSILFVTGILTLKEDYLIYNANFFSWLSNGVALSWLLTTSIVSTRGYKNLLSNSLSELHQKHEAIECQNTRLSRQLDFLPVSVILLNSVGEPMYINKAFQDFFGYKLDFLLERSEYSTVLLRSHSQIELWNKTVAAVQQSASSSVSRNFVIPDAEGNVKYVTAHFQKIEDELEICIVDNTSRIDASKKFLELEKRFKTLLEFTADAVAILDKIGRIMMLNKNLETLSGYSYDFLIQSDATLLFDTELTQQINTFSDSEAIVFGTVLNTADNQVLNVEVSLGYFIVDNEPFKLLFVRDVSERECNLQKLELSQMKYKQLFNNLSVGYALHEIVTDETGNPVDYIFLEVNPAFEKITGLKRENILNKTVLEVLPQTEDYWIQKYGEVATSGRPVEFENYSKELDSYFNVSVFSPQPKQFAVAINDISLHKRAEERIKETKRLYTELVENAQSFIWRIDLAGKYVFVNSACSNLFGYAKDEMLSKPMSNFFPADTKDELAEKISILLSNHVVTVNADLYHKTKSGSTLPIRFNAKTVVNSSGEIIGLQGSMYDLSSALKAKIAIRESERRFDLALRGAQIGLWDWNMKTNELYLSPMWKKIIGFEDDELENSFEQWTALLHPEDKISVPEYVTNFIDQKQTVYEAEFRMIHKNGSTVYILARGHLYLDEAGLAERFTGTHVDVTQQRIVAKELKEHKEHLETIVGKRTEELAGAIAELKLKNSDLATQKQKLSETLEHLHTTQNKLIQNEKMASIGTLTAGVAHEINNPVNFISASISGLHVLSDALPKLMEMYEGLNINNFHDEIKRIKEFKESVDFDYKMESSDSAINYIRSGVDRIISIVNSLRIVARPSEGVKEMTTIENCFKSTLPLLRHELNSNIELTECHSPIEPFLLDSNKFSQIIMNLIVNAIHAIDGQGTIFVESKTSSDGKTVIVKITDSGEGMSKDIQRHIFEPFFTTKPLGKGTGLGLYLCYQIISELNGEIAVDSEQGKGTCFYLSIPIERV